VKEVAMSEHDGRTYPEHDDSLWALAAAPLIWAGHFLLSYGTAAVVCAKLGHDAFGAARIAIAAYTLAALAALAWLSLRGWKRHRAGGAAQLPHGDDSAEDRHRFLGFAVVLLSGLAAVAVSYAAVAVLLIGSCN
jgi:hypothetical protein